MIFWGIKMAKKKNKLPPQSWYAAMNRIYAKEYAKKIRKELLLRPDLMQILGSNLELFSIWAGKLRMDYITVLEDEVIDYLKIITKPNNTRMYHKNVKKWYRIINYIFVRDNYTCTYCGKVGGKLECDHIVPISKGGNDEFDNLVTSCRKCNRQKKDKSVEEFILWKIEREKQHNIL